MGFYYFRICSIVGFSSFCRNLNKLLLISNCTPRLWKICRWAAHVESSRVRNTNVFSYISNYNLTDLIIKSPKMSHFRDSQAFLRLDGGLQRGDFLVCG